MKAFKTALGAIVEGDGPQGTAGTIQNLCGRASDLIIPREDLRAAVLPVITYLIVAAPQTPQNGDHRRVLLQLEVWTDAATGGAPKGEDLCARLETILTQPAFLAQGVDAAPILVNRVDVPGFEDDVAAAGRRRTLLEETFALKRAA